MLTVMFCDIVGSTSLSEQFDAEQLRDLIRQYQQLCTQVIENFDGHIAQYLGDGLLVYFGYPQAREDEAYQAVRSGIEILQALNENESITQQIGEPMRVRIGIHSGAVVIGEMGASGRTERLALGDTPNIAARVQSTARPNEVLISATTYRLVEGLFEAEALGAQDLKGVSTALDLFRVVGERVSESPFEVALSTGKLTRFVGRKEEFAFLQRNWEQARAGDGQVVLLHAEPGMGKSRLAQEFKNHIGDQAARLITIRCSPYHRNSAMFPIIHVMERIFQFSANDSDAQKRLKIRDVLGRYEFSAADAEELIAELLSVATGKDEDYTSQERLQRREQLFEVFVDWFIQESSHGPVFAIWDDLHWADPSTLELLNRYLERVATSATLAILIYREDYTPPWTKRSDLTHLSVNRLPQENVEELIDDVARDAKLPAAVRAQIIERTDGIPLYVEELTRSIVDADDTSAFEAINGDVTIEQNLIPATLQDSLEARLDRLPIGKEIAKWGATLGREFNYAILRAAVDDDARVQSGIQELLEAELIYRSGSARNPTFIFKHALLRDTAYESLLIRRRREYHARIGDILVGDFPELSKSQAEVVAYHYTHGEQWSEAIEYWQVAGQRAYDRSAHREALTHLEQGLAVVQQASPNVGLGEAQQQIRNLISTVEKALANT